MGGSVIQGSVHSADGTAIAFETTGSGPALVLVDAAGHYRGFSSFGGLIPRLAADFTVYHYDRRGRGGSGDSPPYAPRREIEDLTALLDHAGGSGYVYGFSSGGLVALHAAAAGRPIRRLALLEPPIEPAADRGADAAFTAELAALVAAGSGEGAVEHYLAGVGVPDEILGEMRGTPSWEAMVAVAPTLVYDSLLSEATTGAVLAAVRTPTLLLDSAGSSDDLTGMVAAAAALLPAATHRSLPGEWHGVSDDVLAAAIAEYFLD